jgi:regulator of protease activity HflC (stomatin/prohibitin superfamily)
MMLIFLLSDRGGFIEINPGEVAVKYNNSGLAVLGEPAAVIKEQGVISFLPLFQRVEKLDARPQIFVMEGDRDVDDNHTRRLTVRALDGSNFNFERVEIHYQLIAAEAANVIASNGPEDDYKWRALQVHAREVLRDEFGRHNFMEIADPRTYGEATSRAREALNHRLTPLGLEVTNIPPPKPKFDERVEKAIEDRQSADQEVEVQQEKRNKLKQESGRRVQQIEQQKSAEYQQLIGELEAQKQQATNTAIATRRDADIYFIEKDASGKAYRDEKVTRAKANSIAYSMEAEALAAKIRAVGDQGPDVLNSEIAQHVIPQLEKVSARPYTTPTSPIDIRTVTGGAER